MDYKALFLGMHPGFFERDSIRNQPAHWVSTELVMDLHNAPELENPSPCPENITFGLYHGDIETLRAAIREVEEGWAQFFHEGDRVFCAFDGDKIAAFCGVGDMGTVDGLRISGPGCVGTVPAYRKQGIGLEMVRRATCFLRDDGVDIGWIHFTCLTNWYSKVGYKPVFRWNSKGFLPLED